MSDVLQTIHTTIGVYLNCQDRSWWKTNGVPARHLEEHIEYNKVFRFGRALFVDGKCVNRGYLSEEDVARIESELEQDPIVLERDTQPYH